MLRRISFLAWLALGLALLAACSLRQPSGDPEAPIAPVRAFVAALEERDASAIIALLEPSEWRGEIGPELRSYLGAVEEIELSDADYAVAERDGDMALVRVTGTLRYTLAEVAEGGEASGEREVELLVETVEVDGEWYLRGIQLPQPGA